MKRLVDVLNRLSSTSSVSGTQIAKELGITRAAVWRRIKHLQDLGVEILSDHGKGYKLQSDFEKLDAAAIKKISPIVLLWISFGILLPRIVTYSQQWIRLDCRPFF